MRLLDLTIVTKARTSKEQRAFLIGAHMHIATMMVIWWGMWLPRPPNKQ